MSATLRGFERPIRGLCIDLDGTLLDTAPDLAVASNEMLADLGRAPLDTARVASFVGKGADVLVRRCLAATGGGDDDAALLERARERWHARYERINGRHARLFPGVTEGLAELSGLGVALACITNKPGAFVPTLLDRFGLAAAFRFWIAGDTVATKKPHPGQLLEAARRFGLAPADVAMLGDSANDSLAARAAGMRVYLLPYGYNEGRPVTGVDSDGVVATIADFARALARSSAHSPTDSPADSPSQATASRTSGPLP